MTNEQKIAIARIISDMIKADNIIEESEIKDMKKLMIKYSLTQQNMKDARNIRFSEAVTILQEISKKNRQELFDCIYKVALSDNVCVPKEALLLLALQYCLVEYDNIEYRGKNSFRPYLISCPTSESSSMSDQYIVYLESSYDEKCNAEIKENFKLLVMQSRLYGFNFVYIPKMVEELKGMDSQYVMDVISYMAPQLSNNVVTDVYNRLCKMTSAEFFHSVLYEKLKVKVYDAKPSILINIGTSTIPYCALDRSVQLYTEYLCLPIASTTLSLVEGVLEFYKNKVTVNTVAVNENKGQFKYFGFYKALFDFLIAPPPVVPDLVFLGQNYTDGKYYVSFKYDEGREILVNLMPKQYELYYQIAEKTYMSKGVGVSASQVDRTTMCKLRKTISDSLRDIPFVEQYKPEKIGNVNVLRLDSNKVFIRKYNRDDHRKYTDVPIVKYKK